jgi:MFS family permease
MTETTTTRRGPVLALILVGYLLILIDVSILMAALPTIRADLGFSPAGLSWAQNAYTLTFGGLLLLGARVGDLLGRRRTFVIGIGLFTAASLAVGLVQSPAWMIAARATCWVSLSRWWCSASARASGSRASRAPGWRESRPATPAWRAAWSTSPTTSAARSGSGSS